MSTNGSMVEYIARKNHLLEMLLRTQVNMEELQANNRADALIKLQERVEADCFRVMVLGEFKRGKSTFINALLGQEILPAYVVPCTAVINEVKWHPTKKALLHFRDPLPAKLPEMLENQTLRHIAQHTPGKVPPLEIAIDELESYVVIPDPAKDQAESVAETPYDKVELFWPLELCRNGVEIIDSPGLNESGIRTKVTTEYLERADAILFVMTCQALASQSELDFIQRNVKSMGHESIFFICNRFDEVHTRERQRLKDYGMRRLTPLTDLGNKGVHFISAIDALDGRLENKPEMVERSGMVELEAELEHFLVHDRGRVKLLQPANELFTMLREVLHRTIPGQRAMLDKDLRELEDKYRAVKPRLDAAEEYRTRIVRRLRKRQEVQLEEVRDDTTREIERLSLQIDEWNKQISLQSPLFNGLRKDERQEQSRELAIEYAEKIRKFIESEFDQWCREVLLPRANRELDEMGEITRIDLHSFLEDINGIRADLSGVFTDNEIMEATESLMVTDLDTKTNPLMLYLDTSSFFGAIITIFMGIVDGVISSIKSFAKGVARFFGADIPEDDDEDNQYSMVKDELGRQVRAKLRNDAKDIANTLAEQFTSKTDGLIRTIEEKLSNEVTRIREEVDGVLQTMKKGEDHVVKMKKALDDKEADLRSIEESTIELVFSIVGAGTGAASTEATNQ